MKPRLLVLTSSYPRWRDDPDGVFVESLSQRLTDQFDVCVLAPAAAGVPYRSCRAGVRVLRYRYAPAAFQRLAYDGGVLAKVRAWPWLVLLVPPFLAGSMLATIWHVLRWRPDVVHAHWLFPQGLVALLASRLSMSSLPVVATGHGGDLFGLRAAPLRQLVNWVIRNATVCTVVSEHMRREAVARSSRTDIVVRSMGVDVHRIFVPPSASKQRVAGSLLFVGRLVEKKGVGDLLDAVARIREHYPAVRLEVVGDGPLRGDLEARVRALGIANAVSFVGSVPQAGLVRYYQRASVFVSPSKPAPDGDQEGFGLVFAEAAACECAVVATDLAAIADIVEHGSTGVVVPCGDVGALATVILKLLNDAGERSRLGRAARAHVVANFGWDRVAADYAATIEDALAATAARGAAASAAADRAPPALDTREQGSTLDGRFRERA